MPEQELYTIFTVLYYLHMGFTHRFFYPWFIQNQLDVQVLPVHDVGIQSWRSTNSVVAANIAATGKPKGHPKYL